LKTSVLIDSIQINSLNYANLSHKKCKFDKSNQILILTNAIIMKYKLLGKSGLRVSELCLGTMTFGEEWGWGSSKDESQKVFEEFTKAGGNFLDTANRYTEGSSEKILKDLIAYDRDYFVVATKYTLYDRRDDVNASGNHRKNMMRSVEASLQRLGTDYIDLLWVHMWDFTTSVEEVLRGLDDLIRAGKVHYIGISDTPAWMIAKANTMAELRNWTAFVALQIEYSLIQRSAERDLLPMAQHFDLSVTPWGALGSGLLTGKYNEGMIQGARLTEKSAKYNDKNILIAHKVSAIAASIGATPSQVALAWVLRQNSAIIPIIGSRKQSQIQDCLHCLAVKLTQEHLTALHEVSQIELGFPHDFLKSEGVKDVAFGGNHDKIEGRRK
jgi:aryl-alcohol dehydrogenase-like predicted oxidoreductase